MALTPLVVPKRNSRTIDFSGPFTDLVVGTYTVPSVFLATPISTNCPYPQLSSGGVGNDNFYYGAFLTLDGTIIGKYFNTPDINSNSGKAISISSDKLTMNLKFDIFPLVGIKSFPSDDAGYSLGPAANPADNTYTWVGGLSIIQNRDCLNDVYTIGLAMPAMRDDGSGTDGIYAIMDDTGVFFNAFPNDPASSIYADSFITLNDTVWNYTFVSAFPNAGSNGVYLSKWQPLAYNPLGPFVFTNYLVTLSDATDDAFFQTGNDYFSFGGDRYIHANGNTFVYIFDTGSTPLASQTVFIFANDLSWYDRFDITVDNSVLSGTYFQDVEGNDYLIGKNGAGDLVFQAMVPTPTPTPVPYGGGAATNPLRLSEIIKLPCFHPCVPNMKKGLKINV